MALSYWEASLAAATSSAGCPFESVLMLGRQEWLVTRPMIDRLQDTYGIKLDPNALEGQNWADGFFHALGTSEVCSLDYSDYEGAQLIHDMNQPWPQDHPPRQFDVVFDGGTLEHVFNVPQALLNAMSLVKPGGSLLSVTPADGWLGHGFHQLQPEFFFRFLTPANGFRLHGLWLAEFGPEPASARLFQIKDPAVCGCRPLVPGRRPLAMLVFAEKTGDRAGPVTWPGQSNYTAMWQQPAETGAGTGGGTATLKKTLLGCLPDSWRRALRQHLVRRKHALLARAAWTEVDRLEPAPKETSSS